MNDYSNLLSVNDFCKETGAPRSVIYYWVKSGKIQSVKISGLTFIDKKYVQSAIDYRDARKKEIGDVA